jgi:4-hydroxy-tetrahydrodipicolinate reductase
VARVVVCGACGRTGRLVARELAASSDAVLAGGVEAPGHDCVGRALSDLWSDGDNPEVPAAGVVVDALEAVPLNSFDVLVDFSTPLQARVCAEFAAEAGKALVEATTGIPEEDEAALMEAARTVAVVRTSNLSVGANVLFALLERAADILGDTFDVEIVETHHRNKRDAPSGTALTAARVVAEARGQDPDLTILPGGGGPRTPGEPEIRLHSLRGGAVAGRHVVQFMSDMETLAIEHVALSRRAFAVGAVRAAVFAAGSPPGLYDMRDVLGLRERRHR